MKQAFYTSADAIGDLICATPTIRKLSQIYKSPIVVISKHPYIFKNLPYVDESLHFNDFTENELKENYNLHKSFFLLGKRDSQGVEFKHAMCDLRQFHAKDLGFLLTNGEMSCDYYPENNSSIDMFNLPEKYIVIHPSKTWDSRTWDQKNWQLLCDSLLKLNIFIVSIGKNDKEESIYYSNNNKPIFNLNIKNGIDLTNKTTLDQSWHIINKACCVVTMDSGILHLAGTTDTHIVQLGSSIKPEYRAPYRNGTQAYKYSYIIGDCKLFCASDLKYSLRDWGNIQSVTLIGTCLENKPTYECNPKPNKVIEIVKDIYDSYIPQKTSNDGVKLYDKKSLVVIESNSLGDSIGAIAVIEKWRKQTNKDISVVCKFADIFKNSFPDLKIYEKDKSSINYSSENGLIYLNDVPHTEKISTIYKFDVPLLDGYAQDFNINADDVIIKVDKPNGERPIKGKYVCISVHSTAQCKYWNYPGGWDELCRLLRKKGLTPVCVEKNELFGLKDQFNGIPSKSVKRIGMPFNDVLNHIQHCEFFIGLSSGLSWVAQGLGKPTIIISNTTSKDNEYIDENTLRIYDEDVCHGCFHKYKFDSGDWLWCPVFRNDENKRFICTKVITPERVMSEIEKKYGI